MSSDPPRTQVMFLLKQQRIIMMSPGRGLNSLSVCRTSMQDDGRLTYSATLALAQCQHALRSTSTTFQRRGQPLISLVGVICEQPDRAHVDAEDIARPFVIQHEI